MSEKLIPTWKERLAHLDKPTDFAEAQAAKMEAAELRRYIRELESARQPGGGEAVAKIVGVDEYGPQIQWSKHWVELNGRTLYVKDEQ
jgi:hypothetical protein